MSFRSKKSFMNSKARPERNLEARNSSQKMKLELANSGKMDGVPPRDRQNAAAEHELLGNQEASSIKHINLKPRQNESRSTNARRRSKFEVYLDA